MPDTFTPVTWDLVMGGIGSLIFLSVGLEKSLKVAMLRLGKDVANSTLGQLINEWGPQHHATGQSDPDHAALVRDVLDRLRYACDRRNNLVHGLSGARASLHADADPAGYYIGAAAQTTFLQFHQLERDLAMMCHLPTAIDDLTTAILTHRLTGKPHPCAYLRINCLPDYV